MFTEVETIEAARDVIVHEDFVLVYISTEDCSVCHALLPQLEQALGTFTEIRFIRLNATKVPAVASEFSVLTVPAVLFFAEGKEYLREARFVPIAKLTADIKRILDGYAPLEA